jgi:3-oxoacyl-[acyl-carrier protein] reductase
VVNRVALVTGGARGIGAALVTGLAERGHRVAFTYANSRDAADTLERACADKGWDVTAIQADVRDGDAVERTFARVESELDPVEILINNAGVRRDQLAIRMTVDAWSDVLATNLTGPFLAIKRALPKMIRHHFGRIVSIGSAAALTGSPGQANYAASKAGLIALSRVVAREVGSRNITCNVVSPGPIDTDMIADLSAATRADLLSMIPVQRFGSVTDVVAAVLHLCDDQAGYITGALIPVDGGLAMGR